MHVDRLTSSTVSLVCLHRSEQLHLQGKICQALAGASYHHRQHSSAYATGISWHNGQGPSSERPLTSLKRYGGCMLTAVLTQPIRPARTRPWMQAACLHACSEQSRKLKGAPWRMLNTQLTVRRCLPHLQGAGTWLYSPKRRATGGRLWSALSCLAAFLLWLTGCAFIGWTPCWRPTTKGGVHRRVLLGAGPNSSKGALSPNL